MRENWVVNSDSDKKENNKAVAGKGEVESPLFRCEKRSPDQKMSIMSNEEVPPGETKKHIEPKGHLIIKRRPGSKSKTFIPPNQPANDSNKDSFLNVDSQTILPLVPDHIPEKKCKVSFKLADKPSMAQQTSPKGNTSRQMIFKHHNSNTSIQPKPKDADKDNPKNPGPMTDVNSKEKPSFLRPVRTNTKHKTEVSKKDGQSYKENSAYHMFIKKQKETQDEEIKQMISKLREEAKIIWFTEMPEGKPNDSQLQIGFKMGEGSFAKVYEGYDKMLKKTVAIKVFDKKTVMQHQRKKELLQKEVEILSKLPSHENICEFYRLWEDTNTVNFL